METLRIRFSPIALAMMVLSAGAAVQAQPPDVTWTFGAIGSASYRLDAFTPDDAAFGAIGSADPTLPLEVGKRYQVTVTEYVVHPFEVIAKSTSPLQDQVLLSMAIAAPFESSPDVNWQDNGRGTVAFTLTPGLHEAMTASGRTPGYRCRPHFMDMRGDFTVTQPPSDEDIAPSPIQIDLEPIAVGLTAPVDLQPDPSTPGRLYVVEQSGTVRVIDQGQLLDALFLDVRDRLYAPLGVFRTRDANDYDERGFLGLAFHPGYANVNSPGHRRLYTYTSEPVDGPADFTLEDLDPNDVNHQSVVTEWQSAPDGSAVEPDTARVLLRIDQPQFNHNGGQLAFGPDGYLYIALGDGGGANDAEAGHGPNGNGQNIHTVHGSILRIDPLPPELTPGSRNAAGANGRYRIPWDNEFVGIDGADEIFAYGFRNPYRFSFDHLTGALIVADVGQGLYEEVDIVRKGGNYGWNIKEGDFLFDPEGGGVEVPFEDPSLIDPVLQYDHEEGLAVVGGFLYHGTQVPPLRGQYVFGDFSRQFRSPDGRLFVADLWLGQIQELLVGDDRRPLGLFLKGMGQDLEGELYVLASSASGPYGETGVVLKIVPQRPTR